VVVVQYILGVLVIVVGLALSIGLHEVGHLVPAKKFGVRVSQYMIGFGPTIWSRRFGETEYGFKAVPLGGYISMAGMFPPARQGGKARNASTGFFQTMMQDARSASADTVKAGEENRSFYTLAIWKRIIIMLGGPTMNLLIAVALFAVLLCGFGSPQASTTIGSVSQCVPIDPSAASCSISDPLAPAAAAGIRPGDRLISIGGTKVKTWDQAVSLIRPAAGVSLAVVVERSGRQITIETQPIEATRIVYAADGTVVKKSDGAPKTEKVGFLGLGPASKVVQQPISAVLPAVGTTFVADARIIITLPQRLVDVANAAFGPTKRDPNGPISVVGVGRIAGEIATVDSASVVDRLSALIGIIASLNMALFVFNLIPLLPLDGGHVAGALWEGIRRLVAKLFRRPDPGPVDIAKLVPLTFAVVIVLSAMTVLLIYADIVKPVTIQ
jgi:membrane-associated protease RseP (regulator of RpoE activity)